MTSDGLTTRSPSPAVTRAIGLFAVALGVTGLAIGASATGETSEWIVRLVAEAFAVVAVASVGLYATRHEQADRFARLLVLAALALAPNMLALSDNPTAYGIGRMWAWGLLPWVIYLLLSFPLGRLSTTMELLVVGSGVFLVAIAYWPTALLFTEFPSPSPWSDCTNDCPRNPFAIADYSGAGTISKLRDGLAIVIY